MTGQSLPFAANSGTSNAELVERLFREHNEALVRFLLARLRSRQAALEVAQEAYVRLLSLDQPGAVSYLRSFLFKTAANLAVDRLRRDDVHARATEAPLSKPIVIADEKTAALRITGTISNSNVLGWVKSLQPAFGVRAEIEPDRIVLRKE